MLLPWDALVSTGWVIHRLPLLRDWVPTSSSWFCAIPRCFRARQDIVFLGLSRSLLPVGQTQKTSKGRSPGAILLRSPSMQTQHLCFELLLDDRAPCPITKMESSPLWRKFRSAAYFWEDGRQARARAMEGREGSFSMIMSYFLTFLCHFFLASKTNMPVALKNWSLVTDYLLACFMILLVFFNTVCVPGINWSFSVHPQSTSRPCSKT